LSPAEGQHTAVI